MMDSERTLRCGPSQVAQGSNQWSVGEERSSIKGSHAAGKLKALALRHLVDEGLEGEALSSTTKARHKGNGGT